MVGHCTGVEENVFKKMKFVKLFCMFVCCSCDLL